MAVSQHAPLRFGLLGAARIAPAALVRPARGLASAELVALAARDPERARRFARTHGVPRVHESYESLLRDPELDAIYNPLPNGLHAEWSVRALEAGKHVLCEKPLSANAAQAGEMLEASRRSGRELVEAFHWRYHPLAARMREIVRSGELGAIRRIEARLCFPLPLFGDIRYRYELAGGALMDAGCYAVSVLRFLAEEEPSGVASARAKLRSPKVDRAMEATLRFESGLEGFVRCSMFSRHLLDARAVVIGERGRLDVLNPILPHVFHRVTLRIGGTRRVERVPGPSTYAAQLGAFVEHVRGGPRMSSDAADGVANMRVIDAIYEAAGLPLRGR